MAEVQPKSTTSSSSEQPQLTADNVTVGEVEDNKTAEATTAAEATMAAERLPQTDLGEPSIPIPVPAKDTETEPTSKGKDREEMPQSQREESDSLSIGPPDAVAPAATSENPVCSITLLLPTGARHPYKIDERYLAKRNVEVPDVTESGKKDPFSISIYKLKELILREWRDEWEGKPASPSSIRLIHFGKLLDDKEQLKKYQFSQDSPNVVHMSVRPAEMMEEDEAGKGKSSTRDGRRSDGGNGCCVIL